MTDSEVVNIVSKLKDLNETQILLVLHRVLKQCGRYDIPYSKLLLAIIGAYADENPEV